LTNLNERDISQGADSKIVFVTSLLEMVKWYEKKRYNYIFMFFSNNINSFSFVLYFYILYNES
jgi:hypothetical protein